METEKSKKYYTIQKKSTEEVTDFAVVSLYDEDPLWMLFAFEYAVDKTNGKHTREESVKCSVLYSKQTTRALFLLCNQEEVVKTEFIPGLLDESKAAEVDISEISEDLSKILLKQGEL